MAPVHDRDALTAIGEFALIERYFTRDSGERQGVGDDCALIDVGAQTLAITQDMLIEGVHFFADVEPRTLGHKALAVNLSDLAAAGAQPRCFLLGLSLPDAQPAWLEAFSAGMFALAQAHRCGLVGGDTTRSAPAGAPSGARMISITAIGTVDRDRYCGRAGARAGDDLWVSGRLGEAALALEMRRGRIELPSPQRASCLARMDMPEPRVELGQALAGLATAAIDVSDGLLGDLQHILERSRVGAEVCWPDIPRAAVFDGLDEPLQQRCVLAGGDDYELLFSADPGRRSAVRALARPDVPLTRIGRITPESGLRLVAADGARIRTTLRSYEHFATVTS